MFSAVHIMILALLASLMAIAFPARAATPMLSGECVILLHGMGRTSYSMRKLERSLTQTGYDVLNINYPATEPRGTRVTRQELNPYPDSYDRREDPRGRTYYWIHSIQKRVPTQGGEGDIPTDAWAVEQGYVSITPLQRDLTDRASLDDLRQSFTD